MYIYERRLEENMATRLIIEGNAVYEIDEDCQEYQRKVNGTKKRLRRQECRGSSSGDNTAGEKYGR